MNGLTRRFFGVRFVAAALCGVLIGSGGAAIAQGEEEQPETPAEETDQMTYVLMKTTKGDLTIELNGEKAPISVKNFLGYVDDEYYNGLVFHRVIPNFMIQGGGFEPDGTRKEAKAAIKNEWENGLKNVRGSLAMARTAVADSATSQFFINVVDNAGLDQPRDGAAYAVFGMVVDGMEVVDAIRDVETGVKNVGGYPMRDWPTEDVVIETVRRLTEEEVEALKAGTSGESEGDAG